MPYAICPNCHDTFHLKVSTSSEEWGKNFPVSGDGNRYIECFSCWKELKKFDAVEVFKLPEIENNNISVGDIGAVVLVHQENEYEVECVNKDGTTKWLFPLPRNCLKYIHEKNH